jgi:hypothetical protein
MCFSVPFMELQGDQRQCEAAPWPKAPARVSRLISQSALPVVRGMRAELNRGQLH